MLKQHLLLLDQRAAAKRTLSLLWPQLFLYLLGLVSAIPWTVAHGQEIATPSVIRDPGAIAVIRKAFQLLGGDEWNNVQSLMLMGDVAHTTGAELEFFGVYDWTDLKLRSRLSMGHGESQTIHVTIPATGSFVIAHGTLTEVTRNRRIPELPEDIPGATFLIALHEQLFAVRVKQVSSAVSLPAIAITSTVNGRLVPESEQDWFFTADGLPQRVITYSKDPGHPGQLISRATTFSGFMSVGNLGVPSGLKIQQGYSSSRKITITSAKPGASLALDSPLWNLNGEVR